MENVIDYIESGVLEQYVLGELSPHGRAAVEAAAQQEPAIRQALSELQAGLEVYTQAHAELMPADLQNRVLTGALARIRAQAQKPVDEARDGSSSPLRISPRDESTGAVRASAAPAGAGADLVTRSLYPAGSASSPTAMSTPRWAMAASVALLLSLAGNAVLYTRWQQSHAQLVAVQQQQASFAATTQVVDRQLAKTQQEVNVLRDERFRVVVLAGTKSAPTAHARVLYNAATQAVFVDVRSLPTLPAGKQYQLWALDKGKPVDAGILAMATATDQGMQQMKNVARAQAFAMTVEPAGGSLKPTLETMTVMGTVAEVKS